LLTTDLVRVRRTKRGLEPRFLDAKSRPKALAIARGVVAAFEASVGRSRAELEAALDAVEVPAQLRLLALGLRKLCEDRAELASKSELDPEAVRAAVFEASAKAHRALDVKDRFDRARVLAEAAATLGASIDAVEAALYADLRDAEKLERFDPIDPEELVDRYNLALAQGVILRATRVVVTLEGEAPDRVRRLFRAARFHGLLHVVTTDGEGRTTITLDGPFSLFDAVQRYGLRLAMFLPSVIACERFHLVADVAWGKARERTTFELGPEAGLVAPRHEVPAQSPELDAFCEAFQRLGSEWTVAPSARVFALPGEVVCVPDLVFTSAKTGEEVYLEAFGFWSRDAVWKRVELLRKGFPSRILLAVPKQLRVSEEVLAEDDAGELYVYRATMSPRAVLERLRARG
jgi:hypothetical protein